MKKNLLLPVFAAFTLVFGLGNAWAQSPCTVDPSYTSPGIYPSDTLPDGWVSYPYNTTVQFVFPSDTVIFGQTLTFDSFLVTSVTGFPSSMSWDCDQNMNNCTYYTSPPALTRGCVGVSGTPTVVSPSYPAYDSAIVIGEGWVTVPFVGAVSAPQEIAIYYRFGPASVDVQDALGSNLNLEVAPNPADFQASINYELIDFADVRVTLHDVNGREIKELTNATLNPGEYQDKVLVNEFPVGVYFVRVDLNDGEYVKTKKLITVR